MGLVAILEMAARVVIQNICGGTRAKKKHYLGLVLAVCEMWCFYHNQQFPSNLRLSCWTFYRLVVYAHCGRKSLQPEPSQLVGLFFYIEL